MLNDLLANKDFMSSPSPSYNRLSPFLSTMLSRYSLTKAGSTKRVEHIELCLKNSGMTYKPGDSLAIYPLNQQSEVQKILKSLYATGDESVTVRNGEVLSFEDFLLRKANLQTCNKALFQACLQKHPHSSLQQHAPLLEEERQSELKAFLNLYHVSDFLAHFSLSEMSPQELATLLGPMLPRFYSIASSMQTVGETAHLAVTLTAYEMQGSLRHGVASHYLCYEAPVQEKVIPIYLQATKDFTLPAEKDRAMIMIGAGTGVAPFRGFIQERLEHGATGKNWLIFGDRHSQTDFLYETYWSNIKTQGHLHLSTAFSRDQEDKRYVQHLILEQSKALYQWIEEGAYIYVCGDATNMAKAVEQALLQVFIEQEGCTQAESAARLLQLRKDKRYLRDIY